MTRGTQPNQLSTFIEVSLDPISRAEERSPAPDEELYQEIYTQSPYAPSTSRPPVNTPTVTRQQANLPRNNGPIAGVAQYSLERLEEDMTRLKIDQKTISKWCIVLTLLLSINLFFSMISIALP